jgi:hypothetical protein
VRNCAGSPDLEPCSWFTGNCHSEKLIAIKAADDFGVDLEIAERKNEQALGKKRLSGLSIHGVLGAGKDST